ncbi:hypothetical protein QJS83_12710 [Bdellovibrio sp. 22V]|uniref:hypothetical protein n=1 Tax=Bdellovibrio sp. 22V TaxID=3044166 RepID=UPI002542EA90|nr:hypothetical protein [Bdellovibrio sp. 22V]WII71324.1 hypothetical protein QJS83_12710 [Bdellovibrio sp. 22V]
MTHFLTKQIACALAVVVSLGSVGLAKETVSPVLLSQTYSYDNHLTNADDLYVITLKNSLAAVSDWDGRTLEMKVNGFTTVNVTSKKAGVFTVVTDKNYPKNLGQPVAKIENDKLVIEVPQWHALKNGNVTTQYRFVNGDDASPWVQFPNTLVPLIIHQEEIKLTTVLNSPEKKEMKAWLELLLAKTAGVSPNLMYSFRVSYEFPIGLPDQWSIMPVLLVPTKKYEKTDAEQMAAGIENFFAGRPSNSGAQLVFSIIVYKNALPLLEVQEMELPLSLTDLD